MDHLPTFKANFLKAPFLDPKWVQCSTPSYSVVCYGLSCSEKLTFLLTCMCSLQASQELPEWLEEIAESAEGTSYGPAGGHFASRNTRKHWYTKIFLTTSHGVTYMKQLIFYTQTSSQHAYSPYCSLQHLQ